MNADHQARRRIRFSRRTMLAAATVVVLSGLLFAGKALYDSQAPHHAGARKELLALVHALPGPSREGYRVDPYIQAAAGLQAVSNDSAAEILLALAHDNDRPDPSIIAHPAILLCRMLFAAKPTETFRSPMIGGTGFMGDTDYSDWPLEPIELIDGVPFLITQGYFVSGMPESALSYVQYCLQELDWNPIRFTPKSAPEKRESLAKLLASPKWKTPLDKDDREFLSAQIK